MLENNLSTETEEYLIGKNEKEFPLRLTHLRYIEKPNFYQTTSIWKAHCFRVNNSSPEEFIAPKGHEGLFLGGGSGIHEPSEPECV